jgi:hypothetical protein
MKANNVFAVNEIVGIVGYGKGDINEKGRVDSFDPDTGWYRVVNGNMPFVGTIHDWFSPYELIKLGATQYEEESYEWRKNSESKDPNYCGSCSLECHIGQVRDPNSWVSEYMLNLWKDEWEKDNALSKVEVLELRIKALEARLDVESSNSHPQRQGYSVPRYDD